MIHLSQFDDSNRANSMLMIAKDSLAIRRRNLRDHGRAGVAAVKKTS